MPHRADHDDFFTFHFRILRYLLMVPPEKLILKIPYWIVALPHFTLISMSAFMEGANLVLVGGNQDFSSNVLNFGIVILHIMALNRVVRFLFIYGDYGKVLIKVRRVGRQFSDFDGAFLTPQKYLQIMKMRPMKSHYETTMLRTRRRCQRIIKTYLIFVPLNLLVAYVMNYRSPPVEKWNPALNRTSLYREYPYPLWYPFDTSLSDGYYWCGFLYQPYAFYFLISGFFCVDWLCICTIIHLTSFVDVLRHAFAFVDRNVDRSLTEVELLKVKEKRLVICIDQLKDIYECASELNKIFSSQLLIQELCMTGVVCCCLYRVTAEKEAVEAGYLSSMVAAAFVELFTVSWFNQGFTLEILRLLSTIYELDWLNYNIKMRKMLVFLMGRVQKPFHFTMGLGFVLDMTVFITMIKTSYSFYTLITQSQVRSTQIGHGFDD